MGEGFLSRRHTLGFVGRLVGLVVLWGCTQSTKPQESFNLPNRSLTTEPEIQVRLLDLAEFNCNVGAPSTITRLKGKPYAGELTVSCSQKGTQTNWVLRRGATVLVEQQSDVFQLTSSESMTVNTEIFPTTSLSMRIEGDRLEVVGTFDLETYLPGVLQRELYPNWHPNTYRALAVAARSFSLVKMQDRRGKFWHVRASPSDQAFAGGEVRPIALDAVKSTRARFLPGTTTSCVRITPLVVEVAPPVHQTLLPQPQMLLPHYPGRADLAHVKQARGTAGQLKSRGGCLEIELACKPFDLSNPFEPTRGEE